jgi:hypothetical protein
MDLRGLDYHRHDLLRAGKQVRAGFPQLQVDLRYMKLDGTFQQISQSETIVVLGAAHN